MSMLLNSYLVAPSIAYTMPTIQGNGRGTNPNTTTLSVTVSVGAVIAGDLVVICLNAGTNLAYANITWPSGFTRGDAGEITTANRLAWAWKIASGSETGDYTVTWSTGNTRAQLFGVNVRGSTGISGYSVRQEASNTAFPTIDPYTAPLPNSHRLIFGCGNFSGTWAVPTPPTTTPAVVQRNSGILGSVNSTGCMGFFDTKEEPLNLHDTLVYSTGGNRIWGTFGISCSPTPT